MFASAIIHMEVVSDYQPPSLKLEMISPCNYQGKKGYGGVTRAKPMR